MWRAVKRVVRGDRHRAEDEEAAVTSMASAASMAPPPSTDRYSVCSNPSTASSYDSNVRRRHQQVIAATFFGPSSQTNLELAEQTENAAEDTRRQLHEARRKSLLRGEFPEHGDLAIAVVDGEEEQDEDEEEAGDDELVVQQSADTYAAHADGAGDTGKLRRSPAGSDAARSMSRSRRSSTHEPEPCREYRKENERLFNDLVHLANTNQPVALDMFKQNLPPPGMDEVCELSTRPRLSDCSGAMGGSDRTNQRPRKNRSRRRGRSMLATIPTTPTRQVTPSGRRQSRVRARSWDDKRSVNGEHKTEDSGSGDGGGSEYGDEAFDSFDETSDGSDSQDRAPVSPLRKQLNTQLIEAYIAYARSIGREPDIAVAINDPVSDVEDTDDNETRNNGEALAAEHAMHLQPRETMKAPEHWWTPWIGTRFSSRRGAVQFWSFLILGVIVSIIAAFFVAHIALDEVLHLDAFEDEDVVIRDDVVILHIRDEVGFNLEYTIRSAEPQMQPVYLSQPDNRVVTNTTAPSRSPYFQVLLFEEEEFERYMDGETFTYVPEGSTLRTTFASLPTTRIRNPHNRDMYLVIQPCQVPIHATDPDVKSGTIESIVIGDDDSESDSSDASIDPDANYCQTTRLPTPLSSEEKLFRLKKTSTEIDKIASRVKKELRKDGKTTTPSETARVQATNAVARHLQLQYYRVNPMPDDCSNSGWMGASFLLIFLPYLIVSLFGLRVFQMMFRCESFRANLERNYKNEFAVPEAEVDYWQPMPWDRKVPKTRLLGPCCWKKLRHPFEPFYTWWRHENYFTWIFFPYRNERLSRGERAIIVFCSLYITFYVTFLLTMVHDAIGDGLGIFGSLVMYWFLLMLLPSLGKAIFKEIFKLIFRQRRKYFRVKAQGGDTSGFSFRVAFLAQLMVVVCITLAQYPLLYIWTRRSCKFLSEFLYFGLLAAFMRLSLLGLMQDYLWYLVIRTWGWRDLCPCCTERLVHCDCFNDELLVLAVERVGAKWELILVLDRVLSKHAGHDSQFAEYTADQLHERWAILVDRAEKHMEHMEKLRACRAKKLRDARQRRRRQRQNAENDNGTPRLSILERATFLYTPSSDGQVDQDAQDAMLDAVEAGKSNKKRKTGSASGEASSEGVTADEEAEMMDVEVPCCAMESKVLFLNQKIAMGRFEKHYDSNIVDVFHSMRRAIKRGLSGSRLHANSGSSGASAGSTRDDVGRNVPSTVDERGGGHTNQIGSSSRSAPTPTTAASGARPVLTSAAQRLARREEERERRLRAFGVLRDFRVERRSPKAEVAQAQPPATIVEHQREDDTDDDDENAFIALQSPSGTGSGFDVHRINSNPPREHRRRSRAHQSQRQDAVNDDDDDDELVDVVTTDQQRLSPNGAAENDGNGSGSRRACTYAVRERQPTMWEASTSYVTGVVQWAFKYDSQQY